MMFARSLLLAAGLAVSAGSSPMAHAAPGLAVPAAQATATYDVKGMTCEGCASHVKEALAKETGVMKVDVDLAGKRVTVVYDAAKTDTEKLRKAIEKAGYKASLVV
jgi:copper chaperone